LTLIFIKFSRGEGDVPISTPILKFFLRGEKEPKVGEPILRNILRG
jgi:hypothetical protein